MIKPSSNIPRNWLAFELNILRRMEFSSIAMPFISSPILGNHLKSNGVKVLTNDLLISSCMDAKTHIENNAEDLTDEEMDLVLRDAYVPQYKLKNPALLDWFNETDAWWFDNVRTNIQRLSSPISKAIAISIGMKVGDYALSFDDDTRILRQPLSNVYKRFWSIQSDPVNNGQNNACDNKDANEFTAESYPDLMFLRLPKPHSSSLKSSQGMKAWREEWVRGNGDFWSSLEKQLTGKLGSHIETKSQYLNLIEEVLRTASHIKLWAIEHVEDGFISTQDIVETVGEVRRVDTIFTKDFSELLGTKAVIVTA